MSGMVLIDGKPEAPCQCPMHVKAIELTATGVKGWSDADQDAVVAWFDEHRLAPWSAYAVDVLSDDRVVVHRLAMDPLTVQAKRPFPIPEHVAV